MSEQGERRPFTITQVRWHPDGFWTANLSSNGRTYAVDRRDGSWKAWVRRRSGAREFVRREVLPAAAAGLQSKVRILEKRERELHEAAVASGRVHARLRTDASPPTSP